MPQRLLDGILIVTPLLFQLLGLTIAVQNDAYINKRHKRTLLVIIVVVCSLIAQNITDYWLAEYTTMAFARMLVAVYGYCIRPLPIVLFQYVISKRKRFHVSWFLFAVNLLIYVSGIFTGLTFRIMPPNSFLRGPLGFTCHFVSILLLLNLISYIVKEYGSVSRKENQIPLFGVFIIVFSIVMELIVVPRQYPVSYLTVATVTSSIFFYIWLHLQFVREHERALKAEQRIQIMMSQIQPHFLYNTLSTIQALTRTDPDKAFEVTEKFGTYLRQNIDSLSRTELISVREEVEHTKVYAEIEMVRFPNISVTYDTHDDDFLLPALTIQPLVENAIRHGVRIREDGRVTVTVREKERAHEIVIADNGIGFDADAIESVDKKAHIGLSNVRERIASMCGGTVTLESTPGVGTTVTIRIPV